MDVKTISFSSALEKYCELNQGSQKIKEVFFKLSKYRNSIKHFGIDASEKVNDLVCAVQNSFEVILYDLYEILLTVDEYFEYNDFRDLVEPIVESNQEYIMNMCL